MTGESVWPHQLIQEQLTKKKKNEMSVKYMIQGFLDFSKNSMKGCLDKEI